MKREQSVLIAMLLLGVCASAAQAQTRGGFDAKGRLTMHGTPRFVLGVYDSGGSYSSDPAQWEQQLFAPAGSRGLQGFPLNVYLNYWLGGMPIAPTNALLDVLHNHGLMYLQTGNCFADGSWTRYGPGSFSIMSQSYVQQFALHPAALGYYIMDECEDSLIAETDAHDQELHAWDPQGITFAANLAAGYRNPALWVDAADVMGTDPYPLYGPEPAAGYTHFIVADFVSKLRAVAKPNRPVWSVLQFFKFTTDSRLPTADELRAHAVMSVVEGAQGIFWWDIGTNGLRRQDAATVSTYMSHLKTLTTELAGLEPALLADPAPTALAGNSTKFADPVAGRISQLQHNIAVEWLYSRKQWYQEELAALQAGDTSKSGGLLNGAADVRTLTKVVNGVGYVFAYNYTNAARPVTLTWHTVPTSVRESRTGQTFSLSGASWSDTLGPYRAAIYIVQGAGTPPDSPGPDLTLSITNPASGATVSGTTTVTMAATGGTGYTYRLSVDGTTVYTGTNPSFSWNTTTVADGSRTLSASVTDSQSRVATAGRLVTVSNAPAPGGFTVSFTYPVSGATVTGNQTVGISTTATWGQTKTVTLSVDGTLLTSQTMTGTTLWYTWNSTATPNGSRTLAASVTMGGQSATSTLPVTVNNPSSNSPPASVSVTAASGTGPSQTFTYVFSDPNGFADISSAQIVVNNALNPANGCFLFFARAANAIWLTNDAGTQYVGSKTLGVAGTLQNSQCVVDAGASSASGTGNTLTVRVALSFKPTFAGAKTNFMFVADNAGQSSGWQAKGTWTVTAGGNASPTAGSVTPGSGTGAGQTFTYVFSDSNGFADISSAQLLVNSGLSAANGCYLYYAHAANAIWLANDAGSQYVGSKTLGAAGTLQNSQCVVDAGASSASGAGNTLTLNVALSFKPAFAGAKTNYVFVADNAGAASGWQSKGTWTAAAGNVAPTVVSATPGSGAGPSQLFSYVVADGNGFGDVASLQVVINSALNPVNGCFVYYAPASKLIWLADDGWTQWLGPKTAGAAGTLQNSQCIVDASGASSTGAGTALTFTVPLTFKAGFTGLKTNFMAVSDAANQFSGWQSRGTWSVP
jgi:hypothetical protein